MLKCETPRPLLDQWCPINCCCWIFWSILLPRRESGCNRRNAPNRQEHRRRLRAVTERPLNRRQRTKSELAIETHCASPGIDHDANAAEPVAQLEGESEGESKQQLADAAVLYRCIHRKARDAQDGQGIIRQALSDLGGHGIGGQLSWVTVTNPMI
jgi:hypothetical protein